MSDIVPRRRVLLASAAALPLLLGAAGCRSSDMFAGPDPLAGRPPLGHDVLTLQAVIAAEENMIDLYQLAISGDPGTTRPPTLRSLLAQHQQHLVQLKARLILPRGVWGDGQSPHARGGSGGGRPPRGEAVSIARLRAAERASAADLVWRLATAPPALAQLLASIAASDATHVTALGG
ncbi:MAG TPA: hypothetical protein VFX25_25165 [Streptosporangiaceae bacterium]|nr:hypothetical protein [Streptosporangiaceae bacterium]